MFVTWRKLWTPSHPTNTLPVEKATRQAAELWRKKEDKKCEPHAQHHCLRVSPAPATLLEVVPSVRGCTVGAVPPHRGRASWPSRAVITLHLVLASQLDLSKRLRSSVQGHHQCIVPASGSFHALARLFGRTLVCMKRWEGGASWGGCDVWILWNRQWIICVCVCVFSNSLMFAPLGYPGVKFQKRALH